jgi:hypothetical protein
MCFLSTLPKKFGKFHKVLMPFAVSLNICSVREGISCTLRAVHMAQVVSLTEHALSDLLMHIEDETCLKEIPVER